jgi:diguanylate cyclase (GGDEF)-like protein
MEIHIPTLALIAVCITAILGALMLLAWRRDQSTAALGWWGFGYLIGGAAFGLFASRGAIPDVLSIEMANALILLSHSFLYAGARAFGGRATPIPVFLIAPLIWLTAMRVPAINGELAARAILVSSMQAFFVALMAYEFWRGRAEPLLSRWPTIILALTHIAMLSMRMIVVVTTPLLSDRQLPHTPAFAAMAFGTVLYTVTFAFLLLSLTKERSELRHKIAALVDPLTGLANRRAFMSDAQKMIARRGSRNEPMAVLLADLDHFKKINDVFGHSTGDHVLKLFAAALGRCVDQGGLAGRIGGEEFAILLTGKSEDAAIVVAENVRRAFAESALDIDGCRIGATVSIGVASARIDAHDLTGLLGRADDALYRAKAAGRNRVVRFAAAAEVTLVPSVTIMPMRLRAAS